MARSIPVVGEDGAGSSEAQVALLLKARSALLVLALSCAACSSSDSGPRSRSEIPTPENIQWLLPVPAGTRVVSYAPVLPEDRDPSMRVTLSADLTIGANATDDRYALNQPSDIAVDSNGSIYVLDRGNRRVQVYEHTGSYLRTIGSPGQGPGELEFPSSLAVAGDLVLVTDAAGLRIHTWKTTGERISTETMRTPSVLFGLQGLDDRTFVATYQEFEPRALNPDRKLVVARVSAPDAAPQVFATLPFGLPLYEQVEGGRVTARHLLIGLPSAPSGFAASRDGYIHLMVGAEYQILTVDAEGSARHAIYVPWPKVPQREEDLQAAFERLQERAPDVGFDDIDWPRHQPSVTGVHVDGAGRLYVFPANFDGAVGDPFPIDVYSREGGRLFVGFIDPVPWDTAWGDFVYGFSRDAQGEATVVRYRLSAPF